MISSTGNSSNAVSYTSLQNSIDSLSTEKMFRKLSGNSGSVSTGNAKNTDEIGIKTSNSDNGQLLNNGIIRDDSETNISYLKPKGAAATKADSTPQIIYGSHKNEEEFFYDGKAAPTLSSFDTLAAEIGAVGNKISKEQLIEYLNSLKAEGAKEANYNEQIAFVKNLIAKFDTIAKGQDYITSLTGLNDAQDYTTVTLEQVTPPFDLRI